MIAPALPLPLQIPCIRFKVRLMLSIATKIATSKKTTTPFGAAGDCAR
jgi:hypothetical protein